MKKPEKSDIIELVHRLFHDHPVLCSVYYFFFCDFLLLSFPSI